VHPRTGCDCRRAGLLRKNNHGDTRRQEISLCGARLRQRLRGRALATTIRLATGQANMALSW